MGAMWINMSTTWGLSSVQAALNFVISILGTMAMWSCSRYWWQRGGKKVLKRDKTQTEVPLPKILSLAGPGEGYDAFMLLRWKIFSRPYVSLLFQLLVIFTVTSICIFAGPLAQVSLRSTQTVRQQDVRVLKGHKSGGRFGNSLNDNVKWNTTMDSLDKANFPYDQLLSVLPPSDVPWTYVASEWDPIWRAKCSFHEVTLLEELEATGNDTLVNALNAFPKYKNTYDKSWLNQSEIRVQSYFNGETSFTGDIYRIKDMFVWFVLQSDPTIDNRLRTNTGAMRISISALHLKNFLVLVGNDATQGGVTKWRPTGLVANASYTRVECDITKKPGVTGGDSLPWLWSNDTFSLTQAYRANWLGALSEISTRNGTVIPPTPHKLFRFYQAYMIATNTWTTFPGGPITQRLSVWKNTIQISTACLVFLLSLVIIEVWLTTRYAWFLRRNKQKLKKTFIPDGKTDWMIHCAKLAAQDAPSDHAQGAKGPKNRDYFRRASFGNVMDPELGIRGLARVYTSPNINPKTMTRSKSDAPSTPRIVVQFEANGSPIHKTELGRYPSAAGSSKSACTCLSSAANEGANSVKASRSRASSVTFCLPPPHPGAEGPPSHARQKTKALQNDSTQKIKGPERKDGDGV